MLTFKPPHAFRQRWNVCTVIPASLQTCGLVLWFAMLRSIRKRRHDLLWFAPLNGPDPLFLQVGFLSLLGTNFACHVRRTFRNAHALFVAILLLAAEIAGRQELK
jgi:hypothetical protein